MNLLLCFLGATPILGQQKSGEMFVECARDVGVDFTHEMIEDHEKSYLYYSGMAVGAICLGDINGDDLLDIYEAGAAGKNALWLNQGEMRFSPMVLPASLQGNDRWGTGAALVDIDADGDLDFYQCNYDAPNQLFLNDGKGGLMELEGAGGLAVQDASLQSYFADIDNDGDLDLFLLCNELIAPRGRPAELPVIDRGSGQEVAPEYRKHYKLEVDFAGETKLTEYGRKDYLFLNESEDGVLKFSDVSSKSGLQMEGWGLSAVWWDYDGDGDLDLYVANDFDTPDRLFRNDGVTKGGTPRFVNVIAEVFPHTSWSSMGSDVADCNRDGLPDLMSVEMASNSHYKSKVNMGALTPSRRHILTKSIPRQYMRNHLQLNTGTQYFQEVAQAAGIASSEWSWAVKFGDLDNDGYQDVFLSNGMSRNFMNADRNKTRGDLGKARIGKTMWEIEKDGPENPEKNLVFQNLDGKRFQKRLDWGLGLLGMSYSAAMGDLDRDGDLDLVVSDLGKKTKIYANQGGVGNGVGVKLRGGRSNTMGIGAKVILTDTNGIQHTRWMNPWTGFQSQNDTVLHFGLGQARASKVEVFWPSGIYQLVPLNGENGDLIKVTEEAIGEAPVGDTPSQRFELVEAPSYRFDEKEYDDFEVQPLLPQKLSQLGPCLAKGDIDGDGDEDFFVGGVKGREGSLFINQGGSFVLSPQKAFGGLNKLAEDTAAEMFDADNDGDLDLLVVSGSNEREAGHRLYRDQLYLNQVEDGKVKLTQAEEGCFPSLHDSGSCVDAADFDGDGDWDLFIGSRSVPGQYPLAPVSRLIRNDSTKGQIKFTVVSEGNLEIGEMVTDAIWADLDRDGDPDLAVATDWGVIQIYVNQDGKLVESSKSAGTGGRRGWWRSLRAIDVDNDGDLDLVAGNTGVNTKYGNPTQTHPAILYYGDLDGSGNPHIVEAKRKKEGDQPLPLRGRF
ncbi:VCBS repeat-containing protein [Akkermansiaceae bacterium]|nr:VCBS repeat-containing protein [Akkermansiaceae bacterium]